MRIRNIILTFLMAISINFGNERIAVIQSVKGEVRIYSKNKSKPAAVAIIGRSILENDIIRTSSTGECVILYEDRKTYLHLFIKGIIWVCGKIINLIQVLLFLKMKSN